MSDRKSLIHLASHMPAGSPDRKELLKVLAAPAPQGAAQKAIMDYLTKNKGEVKLTDMSKNPAFRGMHLTKIMSAMESLAKKGLITHREEKGEGDFLKMARP